MQHILKLKNGNLLKQNVLAIVNAANISLEGGGGIDGLIHHSAGPQLLHACRLYKRERNISHINIADAVLTQSFDIQNSNPAIRFVIHTAGPNCHIPEQNANRDELLKMAYQNSLKCALEHDIRSIAFPAISTGIFNFPFKEAQKIAIKTIETFLQKHPNAFDEILLVYYSEKDFNDAQAVWNQMLA